MNRRKKANKQKKQAAKDSAPNGNLGFVEKEDPELEDAGEEEKEEMKIPTESGATSDLEFDGQDESTYASVAHSNKQSTAETNATDWIEVTSKSITNNSQPEEQDEEQKVESTAAEKKKKKRNNKKKNAKRKEVQKEFRDRCVSPEYDEIHGINFQADIQIGNLNENYHGNKSKISDEDYSSEEDSDHEEASSDEDLEDYQIEGYHPMHVE